MNQDTLDIVLSHVLKVLGPYANQAVIGGGVALLIYRQYLSADPAGSKNPAATKDVDLVIPRTLPLLGQSISGRLKAAGFSCIVMSLDTPPVESYILSLQGEEVVLDFLTDRRARDRQDDNVQIGGVSAQPLSFMEMTWENRISFITTSGLYGQVVKPDAWLFHKALTFVKRRDNIKRCKDLYGIWYLGTQLGDFSRSSLSALGSLLDSCPASWRRRAKRQLDDWISTASPSDWEMLTAQDPSHVFTQSRFLRFIEEDFPL